VARFDAYKRRSGRELLLVCQSDLLDHLSTRFVLPLIPKVDAKGPPASRLNPTFVVDGQEYVLATNLAATVPVTELALKIASLDQHGDAIIQAIDSLISGP